MEMSSWAVVECETAGQTPVRETLLAVFAVDTRARAFAQKRADQLPKGADVVGQVVEFDGETGQEICRETIEPPHAEATCQCDRCRLARKPKNLMD